MRRDAEMPVLAERTQSGQGANLRQDKLIEDAEPGKDQGRLQGLYYALDCNGWQQKGWPSRRKGDRGA
jgi:hypothetical protein